MDNTQALALVVVIIVALWHAITLHVKLKDNPTNDNVLEIATDSIVPLGITFSFNGVSPLVDYEVVFATIILAFVYVNTFWPMTSLFVGTS